MSQGTSSLLKFGGGAVAGIFMPIMIVIALIFASLSNIEEASACQPISGGEEAKFVYPVSKHEPAIPYEANLQRMVGFATNDNESVHAVAAGTVQEIDDETITLKIDEVQSPRPTDGSGSLTVVLRGFDYDRQNKKYKIDVQQGSHVSSGQVIGQASDGIQMQVILDGDAVNPMDFLEDHSPAGGGCGCGGGGNTQLVGSDNQQKAFNYLTGRGYTKEQAAGVVGNMIHESGVEPKKKQGGAIVSSDGLTEAELSNKKLGWGIVQWTPPGKMIRPSRESGKKAEDIDSLAYQLDFLYGQLTGNSPIPELDAGDKLKQARSVEDAAYAFAKYYERFGGSDDDSNPEFNERRLTAREVFKAYGGGGPGTAAGGSNGCAVTGDIAQTALKLAWPNKDEGGVDRHGILKEDATPEYQQAMPQYNPGPSRTSNYPWTDCGVFTATVIRMTFDPQYQERGTDLQRGYVESHPDKYQIIRSPQSTADVQPGDIMIGDGHTYMYTGPYTGDDGKSYNSAAASWATEAGHSSGRVPMADHWYNDGTYIAARPKKG